MSLPAAAFPCCRAHDLFGPVEDFAEALRRSPGEEGIYALYVPS